MEYGELMVIEVVYRGYILTGPVIPELEFCGLHNSVYCVKDMCFPVVRAAASLMDVVAGISLSMAEDRITRGGGGVGVFGLSLIGTKSSCGGSSTFCSEGERIIRND